MGSAVSRPPSLWNQLKSSSATNYNVLAELCRVANGNQYHHVLIDCGGIPELVMFLKSILESEANATLDRKCQTVRALTSLVINVPEFSTAVCDEYPSYGDRLCKLLTSASQDKIASKSSLDRSLSQEQDITYHVTRAIATMAINSGQFVQHITQNNGTLGIRLCNLLDHPDDGVKLNAIRALAFLANGLSQMPMTPLAVLGSNLCLLLQNGTKAVKAASMRAICNIVEAIPEFGETIASMNATFCKNLIRLFISANSSSSSSSTAATATPAPTATATLASFSDPVFGDVVKTVAYLADAVPGFGQKLLSTDHKFLEKLCEIICSADQNLEIDNADLMILLGDALAALAALLGCSDTLGSTVDRECGEVLYDRLIFHLTCSRETTKGNAAYVIMKMTEQVEGFGEGISNHDTTIGMKLAALLTSDDDSCKANAAVTISLLADKVSGFSKLVATSDPVLAKVLCELVDFNNPNDKDRDKPNVNDSITSSEIAMFRVERANSNFSVSSREDLYGELYGSSLDFKRDMREVLMMEDDAASTPRSLKASPYLKYGIRHSGNNTSPTNIPNWNSKDPFDFAELEFALSAPLNPEAASVNIIIKNSSGSSSSNNNNKGQISADIAAQSIASLVRGILDSGEGVDPQLVLQMTALLLHPDANVRGYAVRTIADLTEKYPDFGKTVTGCDSYLGAKLAKIIQPISDGEDELIVSNGVYAVATLTDSVKGFGAELLISDPRMTEKLCKILKNPSTDENTKQYAIRVVANLLDSCAAFANDFTAAGSDPSYIAQMLCNLLNTESLVTKSDLVYIINKLIQQVPAFHSALRQSNSTAFPKHMCKLLSSPSCKEDVVFIISKLIAGCPQFACLLMEVDPLITKKLALLLQHVDSNVVVKGEVALVISIMVDEVSGFAETLLLCEKGVGITLCDLLVDQKDDITKSNCAMALSSLVSKIPNYAKIIVQTCDRLPFVLGSLLQNSNIVIRLNAALVIARLVECVPAFGKSIMTVDTALASKLCAMLSEHTSDNCGKLAKMNAAMAIANLATAHPTFATEMISADSKLPSKLVDLLNSPVSKTRSIGARAMASCVVSDETFAKRVVSSEPNLAKILCRLLSERESDSSTQTQAAKCIVCILEKIPHFELGVSESKGVESALSRLLSNGDCVCKGYAARIIANLAEKIPGYAEQLTSLDFELAGRVHQLTGASDVVARAEAARVISVIVPRVPFFGIRLVDMDHFLGGKLCELAGNSDEYVQEQAFKAIVVLKEHVAAFPEQLVGLKLPQPDGGSKSKKTPASLQNMKLYYHSMAVMNTALSKSAVRSKKMAAATLGV